VLNLRTEGYRVQVACDLDQQGWWTGAGEQRVATPRTVTELLELVDRAGAFVGNDSGPGHLAAFSGVPSYTLFGPQLPEWFAPLHPASQWMEGKACPYKPCSDYCRFPVPCCMTNSSTDEVSAAVIQFLRNTLSPPAPPKA
jgi:heptosyltransferase-2